MAITISDPITSSGTLLPIAPNSLFRVDNNQFIETLALAPSVTLLGTTAKSWISPTLLSSHPLTEGFVNIGSDFQPGQGSSGGGIERPSTGLLY